MNKIQEFFLNLPDEDLVTAVTELEEYHTTGILKDGKVREISSVLKEQFSVPAYTSITITEINLYREAAARWVKSVSINV